MSSSQVVNVLLIFANPRGTGSLRLGSEDRTIQESIKLGRYRDSILVKVLHAATIHDVRRALLDQRFQIVHVSGHGTQQGLILENAIGEPYIVPLELDFAH